MNDKNTTEPLITIQNNNIIIYTSSNNSNSSNSSNNTNNIIKYQNKEINLNLSLNKLIINEIKKEKYYEINLNNIIGCKLLQNKKKNKENESILIIYCYNKVKESCLNCCCNSNKIQKREQKNIEIIFSNEQECLNWVNAINSVLRNITIRSNDDGIIEAPSTLKYLVYVNPVGGTGNAVNIWNNIRPFLDYASIEYELLITERANHAKDDMATRNLDDIYAVVIVGGDGLIFEVISGLLSRSDSQTYLKKVIFAPIPGGSGNGLIRSILHESNEEYSPENAMFIAVRGKSSPLDLSQVETLNHKYVSFLILGWGFISDCDILSENMRWMGEMRFTVAAVQRLIGKKLYRGRLTMLLQNSSSSPSSSSPINGEVTSSVLSSNNDTNSLELGDGASFKLPPLDTQIDTSVGDWKVIEDDFILVWILQTSHCSSSMYSCPGARLNDGVLTILVVRNISRFSLLTMLLGIDNGDHITHPGVEVYKALAYRLEPLTTEGLYSLDGEVVEYGPIQGVAQPSAMKVFTL